MKNKFLLSFIFVFFTMVAYNQTINISFDAVEKGTTNEVLMDSIYLENITSDTSTTLYSPNFLLILCNDEPVSSKPIGYVDYTSGIKAVYPNPFNDYANIIVDNLEAKEVKLSVYDLTGSLVAYYENNLSRGEHKFQLSTQSPGMYMVSLNDEKSSSYKLMSQTQGELSSNIRYLGLESSTYSNDDNGLVLKSAVADNCFTSYQGDTIMVEAYANCYSSVVEYFVPETSETFTLEFEIDDDIAPSLELKDATIYLNASGDAQLSISDVLVSASDNCTLSDTSISASAFDCSNIGSQDVDVTITDKAGNFTTLSAQVTVEDNLAPELTTKSATVELDENGEGTITLLDVVGTVSDNCSISDTTLSLSSFDCADIGIQTINVTVSDLSGNETIETADVTVEDNIAPTLVTKAVTVELDASGAATITATDVVESAGDNCSLADTTLSQSVFGCNDIGIQSINVTVTDASGNETMLTAQVTVEDNIVPALTTKAATVALDASGSASVMAADVITSASDNCSLADTSLSKTTFNCNELGVHVINVTVTDISGNDSTMTAEVTVEDNIAPTLVTKATTIALDASGTASITATDVVTSASDNCSLADTTLSQSEFSCDDLGVQTINVTVTDSSGNEVVMTAQVTVEDNLAPTLATKAVTIELDESGSASIVATDVVSTASDNCSLADTTLSQSEFSCVDLGVQTINVTVTDSSGNETMLTADVTVEDNMNPTATPMDNTVSLDATGNVTITVDSVLSDYGDNCNISTIDLSQSSFTCGDIGAPITVTITLTDDSGNETQVTSDVTIVDDLAPTATPKDFTAVLDATGNVTINADDVLSAYGDNCSTITPVLSESSFTCADIGVVTVTITLTDESGNETQVTSDVTVTDNAAPVVTLQDITVVLDKNNEATILASDVVTSASDNCELQDTTLSVSLINTPGNQALTVDVTVSDVNGNEFTDQITVTVIDSITDVQDNKYDVVKIGDQVWMADNLRATSYSDGTPITLEENAATWSGFGSADEAYCYYDNDAATNGDTYGVLYTWAAAMNGAASTTAVPSGIQGVCPTGWHIPSNAEWEALAEYISADQGGLTKVGDDWTDIGTYLKSTSGWTVNVDNGTNDYGLNAVPGGNRDQNGGFFLINATAIYWTATENDASNGTVRQIYQEVLSMPYYLKKRGISVRCVMD